MPAATAVCPVCLVAVGAGVGLSQYLYLDDLISGLWLGALLYTSLVVVVNLLIKAISRAKTTSKLSSSTKIVIWGLSGAGVYLATIIILYYYHLIGHELNQLMGVDRLLLGMTLGTLLALLGDLGYRYLKRANQNRAWFPFQKVLMIVLPLGLANLILWYGGW